MEMFISGKAAREWMSLCLIFTKKEKFARHLKKICKRFVKDLKYTHLINIWNVLCVEGNYLTIQRFKVTRNWRDIWHLTSDICLNFFGREYLSTYQFLSDIWHLTSDFWPLTSDIWHLTSDIWLLIFDFWNLTFDILLLNC